MRTVITRNPLISFVALVYGWTWILAALIDQSILFPLLALFGPTVAAIIIRTAMGRSSVAVEFKNRFRLSPGLLVWCILAVLLPFALLFPMWLLNTWWSGVDDLKLNQLSLLSFVVAVLIVGEEIGWRGFLLPYLLQRYSPVTSSLIVGIVWAFWHLPNFLVPSYPHYGLPFTAFVLMTIAFSMLFTWFHLKTDGSLVIAIIFHAALNLFSLSGVEPSREYWLKAIVYSVTALVVYGVTNSSFIPRGSSKGGSSMTIEQMALTASVVFAGLWSGLLGMLTLVMHPMLADMNGAEFERFLRAFLPVARKAWFNYVCAIGMAVAPIVALIGLRDEPSSISFVLAAIGLTIVIVGVYVVSNVWKEPLYDVMLRWDPEAMPADWSTGRQRYFAINWIQAASTWTVFALFLMALIAN